MAFRLERDDRAALRLLAVALAALTPACLDLTDRCGPGSLSASTERACVTPGWIDRAFDVHVPAGWDGASPLPLVLLFHGGGGNRAGADRTTCLEGELDSPACLAARATARGFVVIVPDGTGGRPLRGIRTWNAGGGNDGWDCTSGAACASGVDDVAYVGDVLAEVGAALPLDPRRRYATGISNRDFGLGVKRAKLIAEPTTIIRSGHSGSRMRAVSTVEIPIAWPSRQLGAAQLALVRREEQRHRRFADERARVDKRPVRLI